jgi:hypothetical protein
MISPLASALVSATVAAALVSPPFTFLGEPPQVGELVQVLVAAETHPAPSRASASGPGVVTAGDRLRVEETHAGDVPWLRVEGGWIEAARCDRPAPPLRGDLPPGEEGLASGRILPADWRPTDLVALPDSQKAPGYGERRMLLRRGAAEAIGRLLGAAAADGVRLGVVSAFRSHRYQAGLYARAVERDPAQRSSAAPGRSEHQLGTTVDVAAPGVRPFDAALADAPAGLWLATHAAEYGVVITFSRERHSARGVAHEPWHLRWVGSKTDDERGW